MIIFSMTIMRRHDPPLNRKPGEIVLENDPNNIVLAGNKPKTIGVAGIN